MSKLCNTRDPSTKLFTGRCPREAVDGWQLQRVRLLCCRSFQQTGLPGAAAAACRDSQMLSLGLQMQTPACARRDTELSSTAAAYRTRILSGATVLHLGQGDVFSKTSCERVLQQLVREEEGWAVVHPQEPAWRQVRMPLATRNKSAWSHVHEGARGWLRFRFITINNAKGHAASRCRSASRLPAQLPAARTLPPPRSPTPAPAGASTHASQQHDDCPVA